MMRTESSYFEFHNEDLAIVSNESNNVYYKIFQFALVIDYDCRPISIRWTRSYLMQVGSSYD